jgi:chromosome segregation ATPase
MSDRVNELIENLRERMILLKDQCAKERSNNNDLIAENESLKANLNEKSSEISTLQATIEAFKEAQNSAKEQNVNQSDEKRISDEQIDEMVREIEYCIGQLKK